MTCNYGQRQATQSELLEHLRQAITQLPSLYVVVDALDESSNTAQVMAALQNIHASQHRGLHLLLTSRHENDIDHGTKLMSSARLRIDMWLIIEDIKIYVRNRIKGHPRFLQWSQDPGIVTEIEDSLMKGAHGMFVTVSVILKTVEMVDASYRFLWAVCVTDELLKSVTLAGLKASLEELPTSLYETYDRILLNIDAAYMSLAIGILECLAFIIYYLTSGELLDALAIVPGSPDDLPSFDKRHRLFIEDDVHRICQGLVTLHEPPGVEDAMKHFALAHSSVKEYLCSQYIREGPVSRFHMGPISAHVSMAQRCLAYRMHMLRSECDIFEPRSKMLLSDYRFPFGKYANHHLHYHLSQVPGWADSKASPLFRMLMKYIKQASGSRPNDERRRHYNDPNKDDPMSLLSCAVEENMDELLPYLAGEDNEYGIDLATDSRPLILCGFYHGGLPSVPNLLRLGANTNGSAIGWLGLSWTPVGAAIYWGHMDVANKNVLQIAAEIGDSRTISLLIHRGLDVDSKADLDGLSPLCIAVLHNNTEAVGLLLKKGAVVSPHDVCRLFDEVQKTRAAAFRSYSRRYELKMGEQRITQMTRGLNVLCELRAQELGNIHHQRISDSMDQLRRERLDAEANAAML
ncbi:MAG: hypothetical protein Q9222_000519 [Ikaeria aurantiellina]